MKPPHHGGGAGKSTKTKPGGKPPGAGRGKPPPSHAHHKKPVPPAKPPRPVPPKPHKKPRGLSPGSDVACCSAQALGMLLGWDWDQVLALYWRTASDPDAGASILATLQAWRERDLNPRLPDYEPGALTDLRYPAPLILGVELPGPHAIAVTPDGRWWSWGEPFDPAEWPDLVIEEAWCLP